MSDKIKLKVTITYSFEIKMDKDDEENDEKLSPEDLKSEYESDFEGIIASDAHRYIQHNHRGKPEVTVEVIE